MNKHLDGLLAGVASGLLGLGSAQLVPLVAAWMFRAKVVPLDVLAVHLDVMFILLAGSLAGAWWGRARRAPPSWLDHVLAGLMTVMACALLVQSWPGGGLHRAALFDGGVVAGVAVGVVIGIGIGALFAYRAVAGAVVLVAALVLSYGRDIKVAGSLALMIGVPTLLVAGRTAFAVQCRGLLPRSAAAVAGAALGTLLLTVIPSDILMALLAVALAAVAMQRVLPARRAGAA